MTVEDLSPSEREEWEERAAIIQFEAGSSRELAEQEALRIVLAKRVKPADGGAQGDLW